MFLVNSFSPSQLMLEMSLGNEIYAIIKLKLNFFFLTFLPVANDIEVFFKRYLTGKI